ncbi:hypothetical protein ACKVV7_011443 [Pyricularia oryzae]
MNANLAFLIQYLNDMEQRENELLIDDMGHRTLGPLGRVHKSCKFAEKATLGRAEAGVAVLEYSRKSNAAQDNATRKTVKVGTMVDANMGQNIIDELRSLLENDPLINDPPVIPVLEAVLEAIDGFEQEGDAQWDTTRKEPDWASITIYPTFSGNADKGAGKDMAALLTKPNGDMIKPVTKLSHLDVEKPEAHVQTWSQLPPGEAPCG